MGLIIKKYVFFIITSTLKKQYHINEFWIHIIVWVCLFSFPISVSYVEYGELRLDYFYPILLNPVLVYLNYLVLVPRLLLNKKIGLYIILSVIILVTLNFIATFTAPAAPIEQFRELLKSSDITPLRYVPTILTSIISLAFFLLGGVLGLVKDFYVRERIHKEKEVQRKETELQFLRAQLNPHFLFNSLNSIYSLVRNKANEAPEAVITLSELMRYMLYEAKRELVPLSKEIDYIKNYVTLQLLRLADSENVKLKISGDYDNKEIQPLLFIPFVENAFKYGTDYKGMTYVDIKFEIIGDNLFFLVKNKIGFYKKDDENSGIGFENIRNILKLLYPENHVLKIEKTNAINLTLDCPFQK